MIEESFKNRDKILHVHARHLSNLKFVKQTYWKQPINLISLKGRYTSSENLNISKNIPFSQNYQVLKTVSRLYRETVTATNDLKLLIGDA